MNNFAVEAFSIYSISNRTLFKRNSCQCKTILCNDKKKRTPGNQFDYISLILYAMQRIQRSDLVMARIQEVGGEVNKVWISVLEY